MEKHTGSPVIIQDLLIIFFCLITKENAMAKKRKYGLGAFVFDLLMICLTCGLWLIWIFCREMRNR